MKKLFGAAFAAAMSVPMIANAAQVTQDQMASEMQSFGISDALPYIFLAIILLTLSSGLTKT